MVKITKTLLSKHKETLSPFIENFVLTTSTSEIHLLPQQLASFPSRWPFPRGDLYHWIPLLNRFDDILDSFCKYYELQDGPQTKDFGCGLLIAESSSPHELHDFGYGDEGDRQLVESILCFSRVLLENCGNRSIYASSPHLSDLLHSTSLSLIASALQIGTQLAQRYQASFKRMSPPHRHANQALLANHYNINLDRVQHLAQPFVRTVLSERVVPTTPATPNQKGKEKTYFNVPPYKSSVSHVFGNDLVSMVRTPSTPMASNNQPIEEPSENEWNEWGDVRLTYYASQDAPNLVSSANTAPVSPTPIRRTSSLGHRSSRPSGSEESPSAAGRSTMIIDDTPVSSLKVVDISNARVASASVNQLLKETVPQVPVTSRYELLNRLRVANAMMKSTESRRQAVAVRILAITNLAYIHAEPAFLEKVMKQDSDEPRRHQLIYQLAELIQPPAEGQIGISRWLQTIALSGLEALAQHPLKHPDICMALNTNVNHGILLYTVRKAVSEMAADESGDIVTEDDEWRDALFSLLSHVATLPRAGADLTTAGLVPILISVLNLRTNVAEHNFPKVLNFLDAVIFNVRDALQILMSSDGLESIANLIVHETKSASEQTAAGKGVTADYRSQSIDYQIPYFKQQSIKWLFKFIHHMMTTAGGYGSNFDRLLRNLIDSPQLLGSLREIIGNGECFGSTVWTHAISILNDFINNEPASYNVIAEAGLSRQLLEAVTGHEITVPEISRDEQSESDIANDGSSPVHTDDDSIISMIVDDTPHPPTAEMLQIPRDHILAQGIMPSSEAINIIPQAFGAICLNNSGMRMLQSSNALQSFFEIFESPSHVKCMENDQSLVVNLGATFDELVRHHPSLKTAIINAMLDMVARVGNLCKTKIITEKTGAKLWITGADGKLVVADENLRTDKFSSSTSSKGKSKSADVDVEMGDATELTSSTDYQIQLEEGLTNSATPYVFVLSTFLATLFANPGVKQSFIEKSGIEYILDLAELPILPSSFLEDRANRAVNNVLVMLVEQKPHLLIPSLIKRALSAIDTLKTFTHHTAEDPYFGGFVDETSRSMDHEDGKYVSSGTSSVEALVRIQNLAAALRQCVQTPMYNHRTSITSFNSMNLADYYTLLIESLGRLLGASIREDFRLQAKVPIYWKRAESHPSRFPTSTPAEETFNDTFTGLSPAGVNTIGDANNRVPRSIPTNQPRILTPDEKKTAAFKNYVTLSFLLGKLPRTISPLFQSLGKALIPKRNPESFQRQNHVLIATALAETVIGQLKAVGPVENSMENLTYWVALLDTVKNVLINASRNSDRPSECITLVLQAFKRANGFKVLNHILLKFAEEMKQNVDQTIFTGGGLTTTEFDLFFLKKDLASVGTSHILELYVPLVTGKNVVEATQTASMMTRTDRDRSRPDSFSPGQFLVELRMAVLPVVRELWESDLVEKGGKVEPKSLIDIIKAIAAADHEHGAYRRSDKVEHPSKVVHKFQPTIENVPKLLELGYSQDLAIEALFRCNNQHLLAQEYCKAQVAERSGGRNQVPAEVSETFANLLSRNTTSSGTATPDSHAMQLDEALSEATADLHASVSSMAPPPVPPQLTLDTSADDPMAMSFDTLLNGISGSYENDTPAASITVPTIALPTASTPLQPSIGSLTHDEKHVTTIEDLEEERGKIRSRLIDRSLDVINAHGQYTFEIDELITRVVEKSPEPLALRKEIGETLVNALLSFDVLAAGSKIAAYAHLLALMLQDKSFYEACVGELQSNLEPLLEFIKLSPSHSPEESSPWIAHILLIVETLLCEDTKPQETDWKIPIVDTSTIDSIKIDKPVLRVSEPVVSTFQRGLLFDSILEILPRIGKDESVALAVLRILVILTRSRHLAQAMGEKKNIQRLFVMAKQLAGTNNSRLQSPLMLILRHIIEDDDTVRQIMRSEIRAFFESSRATRHTDVSTYIRQMSCLVIRSPELFVEVTNEMVKLAKWSSATADSPTRQIVELQDKFRSSNHLKAADTTLPSLPTTAELSLSDLQDVKPTIENGASDNVEEAKLATVELKAPMVENPDGVIHFLLCELLNYKDVEDKEPANQPPKRVTMDPATAESTVGDGPLPESSMNTPAEVKGAKKTPKQEFKAEEHPIYFYRCFLLQCLTELLSCYNRTKVEFINFKRSAAPQAMTPSKPRSNVLNYLLFDLIPAGTLDHAETIAMRKKLTTASSADSVICALLSKTGEQILEKDRDKFDCEDEPDLFYVRKFVLENILKSYREASSSNDPLDMKYSRMLSLADLMSHIMTGKENHGGGSDSSVPQRSVEQLKRIMFDKGYVAALTASIADIDLNFPSAKRAVKHILRPLRVLTHTAIDLSDAGKIVSANGQTDEDEIESASSVSDIEDTREETPDLFRNSSLGMLEPSRDQESSSDSGDDDDEMYEGEYDDEEMDYEEEMAEDDEDNISDEDEELEAMGEIEGLPGDHGVDVEVIMDDDDDDGDDASNDEDDENSEDLDDEEEEDEDERVEIIDGDGSSHPIAEGDDEDDWQSDEDEEEDYEGRAEEEEERLDDLANGTLGQLVRVLGGDGHDGGVSDILQRIGDGTMDPEEQMELQGYLEEAQDEEEDDEDDEDADEDDAMYDEYPTGPPGMGFEWNDDSGEPRVIISHRGHHPRHGLPNPIPFFPGGPRDPQGGTLNLSIAGLQRASDMLENLLSGIMDPGAVERTNPPPVPEYRASYRTHRPGSTPRANDDGTNPLLQRIGPLGSGEVDTSRPGNSILDMSIGHRSPFGESPAAILSDLITSLPMPTGAISRHRRALHFHVNSRMGMTRDLQEMFGLPRSLSRMETRRDGGLEPGHGAFFAPQGTFSRWSDEAKLLFGSLHTTKAIRVLDGVMAVLVPPALKAEIQAIQDRKAAEEKRKREEEEKLAKERKLAEERAAQEKAAKEAKEAERRAAEQSIAREAAADGMVSENTNQEHASENNSVHSMEGIESTTGDGTGPVSAEATSAAERPRATVMIRGSAIDITDLGMDAEFLEELPEELREEVIAAALTERRLRATNAGAQPSDIDQEFLNALPDDIRHEIIEQERHDRRRREREEQRRQAAANGSGQAAASEMDPASILATFPPELRAQILVEQDDEILAQLPPEYAAEARSMIRNHPLSHLRHAGAGRSRPAPMGVDQIVVKSTRRNMVQMLDKPGVATLLRLMFVFQQDSLRNSLFHVLENVSENRHNRGEVISTLLHILQDGSADMTAVERSFAHLSLRAKQPKDKEPRTQPLLKRTSTGTGLDLVANYEVSPLMVVQQCLGALIFLCKVNVHVASFFLTEHDSSATGLKRTASRKGKGKEIKAAKFALNSLLTLLDRQLIMDSSTVMETLSDLLSRITGPLQALERKQKDVGAADASATQASQVQNPAVPEEESLVVGAADEHPPETMDEEDSTPIVIADGAANATTETVVQSGPTAETKEVDPISQNSDLKKPRPFIAPVVPESNLKLVINIFLARECSARTFRDTLSTIKHLSCIPGAKVIFGRELVHKAQGLAEVILVDLGELLPQIRKASTGTEVQGIALAKFSPSGSDQNKLLRVLTALDHLFEPKNNAKKDIATASQSQDDSSKEIDKQDLLATLYENSTFGPMWDTLSACLKAIRQREHMLSVATILLPLIESLMVVCKNTNMKDAQVPRLQTTKELMLTSPPPESRMESLFFNFTGEHRKILNDLVRHNPKLMIGTFSLLVKNPTVLDFDNKRNYFTRSIHNRNNPNRPSFPPLQLSLRRDLVFHDSFKSLYFKPADEMKFGKLSIRFHGEEGVDAGGVTREWFQVLCRQMFDPGYALFIPVSSDRTTFHPNHMSSINTEHLMFFKFIGRVIGKALFEGRVLDCHFSRAVYKSILGKAVSIKDMESLDPDYYKSVIWMLENDITDIITETFSVENDNFGLIEIVDLIENGRNIPVTQENKQEYIRLMVEFKLTGSVREQLDNFLKGFHEIIPAELVAIFNEQELELLISGLPEIDVDDWKGNTDYHNYTAASPQMQWFWRVVRSFDKEERAKLLQFVTGTSKVPLNGFKELEGMNGFSRFNIHRDYGSTDRLPSSHTCFNQLDIPEYDSYETLRLRLHTAITVGSEGFGFA